MQGNPQVIDGLNRALTIELTAINQYFCQAKMCQNWGFMKLGAKHYEESMGEMKHAERLIDRIIFLEGVPEIARYDVIRVGTNVKEQFENDLTLEMAYDVQRPGRSLHQGEPHVAQAGARNPGGVRGARGLAETQPSLIDTVGLERYLACR